MSSIERGSAIPICHLSLARVVEVAETLEALEIEKKGGLQKYTCCVETVDVERSQNSVGVQLWELPRRRIRTEEEWNEVIDKWDSVKAERTAETARRVMQVSLKTGGVFRLSDHEVNVKNILTASDPWSAITMVHHMWELFGLERHIHEEIVGEQVLLLLSSLLAGTRMHDLKVALSGCLWSASESSLLNALRMARGMESERQTALASLSRCLILHLEKTRSRNTPSTSSSEHELEHHVIGAICSIVQCSNDDRYIFGLEAKKESNPSSSSSVGPISGFISQPISCSSISANSAKSGFILKSMTQSLSLHYNHFSIHSALNVLEHVMIFSSDEELKSEMRRQFVVELDGVQEMLSMVVSNIKTQEGVVQVHAGTALRGMKIISHLAMDPLVLREVFSNMAKPQLVVSQLKKILDVAKIMSEDDDNKCNDVFVKEEGGRKKEARTEEEEEMEKKEGGNGGNEENGKRRGDVNELSSQRVMLNKVQLELAEHVALLCYGMSSGLVANLNLEDDDEHKDVTVGRSRSRMQQLNDARDGAMAMLSLVSDWLHRHPSTTFLSQSHVCWIHVLCTLQSLMFSEMLALKFTDDTTNVKYLVQMLSNVNLVTNAASERVALIMCVIARHPPTRPKLLTTGVRSLIIHLFDKWEETNVIPKSFSRSTMRKLSLVVGMCCNCTGGGSSSGNTSEFTEREVLLDIESIKDSMVDTDKQRPLRDDGDVLLRLVGVLSSWSLSTNAKLRGDSRLVIDAIGQVGMIERLVHFLTMLGAESSAVGSPNSTSDSKEITEEDKQKGEEDKEKKSRETREEKRVREEREREEEEKKRRVEKWSAIEKEAETRARVELGKHGEIDMTQSEVTIALRALVESSAGLLLSILQTPSGCRAALSSSTVVTSILAIAKRAQDMTFQERDHSITEEEKEKEEDYGTRVYKVILCCAWSLLRFAPMQEYPRFSSSSKSCMSFYAKMLLDKRFVDELEQTVRAETLSPSVRILACEFRSAILYSMATVVIIHGTTHRDHSHKFHKQAKAQQVEDEKTTCSLHTLLLSDKRAIVLSYAAMGVAREAYKPHVRSFLTKMKVIPLLLNCLEESNCGRLDTYLIHALMNLSAGEIEQKILGKRETILLLLSCVEKRKNRGRSSTDVINFVEYDLYRHQKEEYQSSSTTWTSNLRNPYFTHVLSCHSPHEGYMSDIFASRTLHNIAKNQLNRTMLYKIELQRAAAAAAKETPVQTVVPLRFDGISEERRRPKDPSTHSLRQKFDTFLDDIGANQKDTGKEKKLWSPRRRDGSATVTATTTATATGGHSPQQNKQLVAAVAMIPQPPQRGRVESKLRKPLSSIWKKEAAQSSPAMKERKLQIMNGLKSGTVGRTRFDMLQHSIISSEHPSSRPVRCMPAMTMNSRQHPRSKRWRPTISNIGVTKEALETTGGGGSGMAGPETNLQLSSEIPEVLGRRGSAALLTAPIQRRAPSSDDPSFQTSPRRNSMAATAKPVEKQASSGVTSVQASDTTEVSLEPMSPRHSFKFRATTVNRVLVICFNMVLHGFGSDTFNDFVQRSFLRSLSIRLDLDEELAIGCQLSTTMSGAVQHSPFRVKVHVSIEAEENGHDVASNLIAAVEKFKDMDVGRAGHQPMKKKNEKSKKSPLCRKKQQKNLTTFSPAGSPKNGGDDEEEKIGTFTEIMARELIEHKIKVPKNLEILSISNAHKAFEDTNIFGALDPDADVSLGLWSHVPGSTISTNLFPKYVAPNGKEFFLYTKKNLQDLGCPHADSLEALSDAASMEENLLILDQVVTAESIPSPELTTHQFHDAVLQDAHDIPIPPTHALTTLHLTHGQNPGVSIPMDDERFVVIVSVVRREKKLEVEMVADDVEEGEKKKGHKHKKHHHHHKKKKHHSKKKQTEYR